MDLHFLDGPAPELKSWLTDQGGYLFEERPDAVHWATIGLRAAYGEEATDADRIWRRSDHRNAGSTRLGARTF